jgi:D-alanine-D-alanine ligase-like ATP-grasp enzyme
LPKDNPKITLETINNRMKELIKISMESVKAKLNSSDRKHCFEIFGYDFIMDAEFNVWIIEVNSNPSIEESNALLEMLVPRMIGNKSRLIVYLIFQR